MSEVLLEIKNVTKVFSDGVKAVDNVSFTIESGESVGLVGESGSGKSTMARLISGLIKADSGTILVCGKDISKKRKRQDGCLVNMIFQDSEDSFDPRMTVYQSLYEALKHTGTYGKREADNLIDEALATVNLNLEYKNKKITMLSGGECQRVAIARSILTKPKLLICDEATSALDVSVQAQIIKLFNDLKKSGTFTSLFISHDLALVACLCSRIIVFYNGRIVESGPTMNILKNPQHPYTKVLVECAEAFTIDDIDKQRLPVILYSKK